MRVELRPATTRSIEASAPMPVAAQERVQQTQQQPVPQGKAPSQRQTPDSENSHDLASGCGAHDFPVHHAQPSPPKKQFCKGQKKQRYTQQPTLPALKDAPVHRAFAEGKA